ncbi:type II toxin-antitoxin system VapC family toxin [Methylocystis iwaonis]|uniref:type II toxin-antitoxin system VapC family toxin n=1 Tax=Methylocystis iwaonis TaxID=2885079 RepID=UPI002E7C48FB|nr:type II toxin-antitoxin system VapC family toxin [Methylocystis iwaonis]
MKITPDTNVLVRIAVGDDPRQQAAAVAILKDAQLIAVTLPTLCEFGWVLSRGYKRSRADIAEAIRTLIDIPIVVTDRSAAEAGLAMLESGGDFADGVIAFDGRRKGGDVFVSFDRKAVKTIEKARGEARLLKS